MKMKSTFFTTTLSLGAIALVSFAVPSTVYADRVIIKHNKRVAIPAVKHRPARKVYRSAHHHSRTVVHRGPAVVVKPNRARYFRNVYVIRPYGHFYTGYGWYKSDNDAYKWLAFTAITLKVLDNLNEEQQRLHEDAQIKATNAKVGEVITWNNSNAVGSVKVVRAGTSSSGRQCREFQQRVTIGGKTEQAYGTACLKSDGSWEMVSTDSR